MYKLKKGHIMSKTKSYYWDEAEKFVDNIACQIKNNMITFDQGVKEIMNSNQALELIGIYDDSSCEECLYYAVEDLK
jgi:hypothetical protein